MSETSGGLPLMAQTQSSRYLTYNEAMWAVNVLQTGVIDRDLTSPPGSPSEGDAYIVNGTATGAWAGKEDKITFYFGGVWNFLEPELAQGNGIKVLDEDVRVVWNGSSYEIENGADASTIPYTPGIGSSWGSPEPTTVGEALDQASGGGGGGGALDDLTDVDAPAPSDGDVLTYDSGSGDWIASAPTGGGGMTKIAEVVTSGSQATVTFSSIPGTYRHLRLIGNGRGSASAVASEVRVQFNGDTGSNYDYARWTRAGTSENVAQTASVIGEFSAANAPSNAAGSLDICITYYANTTFQKPYHGTGNLRSSTLTSGVGLNTTGGTWRSTAAITSIAISLASGNFVDGSLFTLYGIE